MITAPVFSIVIPTYNRSALIGVAIRSVLNQSFRDFELIIVDDGSTDDTKEVVSAFNDPRIKYFFKKNEERSIARNYGIEKSFGKYLNFLDSDDFFYPHHLATAYKYLDRNSFPELLHLEFEVHIDSGGFVRKDKIDGNNINRKLIHANLLCGASFIIRRDVLSDCYFIPHRDATVSEDWYLWLKLAARFPIHLVDCVTCVVREHGQRSLRTVNHIKVERSLLLVIKELRKDTIFLQFYNSSFSHFVSECYSLIALHHTSVNWVKSLSYLLKSIYEDPAFVRRRRCWAILKNLIITRVPKA